MHVIYAFGNAESVSEMSQDSYQAFDDTPHFIKCCQSSQALFAVVHFALSSRNYFESSTRVTDMCILGAAKCWLRSGFSLHDTLHRAKRLQTLAIWLRLSCILACLVDEDCASCDAWQGVLELPRFHDLAFLHFEWFGQVGHLAKVQIWQCIKSWRFHVIS